MNSVEAVVQKTGFFASDRLLLGRRQDERLRNLLTKAKRAGVSIEKKSYSQLDNICGAKKHQGIALLRSEGFALREQKIENTLAAGGLLVALDGVVDPQNAGSIIRSMAAFNAGAVVVSRKGSAPLGATALKASAGALADMPVVFCNLNQFLLQAKEADFLIVGADQNGSPLAEAAEGLSKQKLLLVMGSEGRGLSKQVKEKCDLLVRIVHSDKIPSLNVANAATILLHEIFRLKKN